MCNFQILESRSRLCVVGHDDNTTPQPIDYSHDWKVLDLKKHLCHKYPGEPSVESLQLIFAGHCLGDDMELNTLLESNPGLCILFLVVDSAPTFTLNLDNPHQIDISNRDIWDLRLQYSIYLQDFYARKAADFSSGSSSPNYTPKSTSSSPVPDQQAEAILVEPIERENAFQRAVRFLGNRANGNADDGRIDLQAEDFDFVEFAYALFRIGLMFTICIAYSSWHRMVIVASIAATFYWFNRRPNRLQQYRPLPLRVEPPLAHAIADTPIEGQQQGLSPSVSSRTLTNADSTPARPVTRDVERFRPLVRIISFVRLIAIDSFRFICTLIHSLVPRLPENQ